MEMSHAGLNRAGSQAAELKKGLLLLLQLECEICWEAVCQVRLNSNRRNMVRGHQSTVEWKY